MKVLKFGGSSVSSPERINEVLDILEPRIKSGEQLTVVFSAFGGVTDYLIEMSRLAAKADEAYLDMYTQFCNRHFEAANALLNGSNLEAVESKLNKRHKTLKELMRGVFMVREASPRSMDFVLSYGERNANLIIAAALRERAMKAEYLDARKIVLTNKDYGYAKVNFEVTNPKIKKYFDEHTGNTLIVTGFIGSDAEGVTTTLGRGGSDYTAAILGNALDAESVEIWTDVDGVLTSDPRKVKKVLSIPKLSYSEAMELSHFGAKVIYPPTLQPVLSKGIPIFIKNTLNPSHTGTQICNDHDPDWPSPIKGITSLGNIALLNLEGSGIMGVKGASARLFKALADRNVNIILITQASSEYSICFAIDQKDAQNAKQAIEDAFESELATGRLKPITIEEDLSIVAVVGKNMKAVPGVAGKLFQAMGRNGVNVIAIAQGSSERNISFVIHKKDEAKALNLIHDAYFLSETRTFNLFIVGVGLIGSTLLEQFKTQKEELKNEFNLTMNIVGIANSKKMYFDADGINLENWRELLEQKGETSDVAVYVDKMKTLNLPSSIFIDNTANKDLPDFYHSILDGNISIITPNKVATSSSYANYLQLKEKARQKGIFFLYETNVGAGLPVISTIKNLINSGDKILSIEAVVSGSLSFIFNSFDGSKPFSELVKEAKAKGFTEPDPREDLSGNDVKRKIIILTREAGFPIEPDDVILSPILPDEVMEAENINAFFEKLKGQDNNFAVMATEAKNAGKVLRFIAKTTNGKAEISMSSVGQDSPFYSLSGADNMVVITTNRYKERPLVVKGPGAGAEVTAAGVFADLLTIANIA